MTPQTGGSLGRTATIPDVPSSAQHHQRVGWWPTLRTSHKPDGAPSFAASPRRVGRKQPKSQLPIASRPPTSPPPPSPSPHSPAPRSPTHSSSGSSSHTPSSPRPCTCPSAHQQPALVVRRNLPPHGSALAHSPRPAFYDHRGMVTERRVPLPSVADLPTRTCLSPKVTAALRSPGIQTNLPCFEYSGSECGEGRDIRPTLPVHP